jgi:capsular exopolysaccharide synthesis family protein
MEKAENDLLNFQTTHKLNGAEVIDAPTQQASALNSYLQQSQEVADIENQYAVAKAKASLLQTQLNQVNNALKTGTSVRDDSEVIALQQRLQDLKLKREEDAEKYTEKYPGVLPNDDQQIADTTQRLTKAIQSTTGTNTSLASQAQLQSEYSEAATDASTLSVKLQTAIQRRDSLLKETSSLPTVRMQADRLTEAAADARALYNALTQAATNAQLDLNIASGDIQVSEPAFAPEDPFTPNHKRDIALGFGIGFFLSLLAVLILEQGDRFIRSPSDVRRLAEGPVIGALSNLTRPQLASFNAGDPPSYMIETYNTARANLTLAFKNNTSKSNDYRQVILVTSSIAGEGKSMTAAELAQSYARSGKRVALVNADMRRKSSHPLLASDEEGKPGFAEILSGEITVEKALVVTDVPNLVVIHSGTPKKNPVDLISTPRMASAMRALRRLAEIVIIDTPPSVMVADALLIASHVDSVVHVVGLGMVDVDTVRNTAANLAAAGPKTLTYFVNRVPKSAPVSPYYRHYTQVSFDQNSNGVSQNGFHKNGDDSKMLILSSSDIPETNGSKNVRVISETPESLLERKGTCFTAMSGPYEGQTFHLASDRTISVGGVANNDLPLTQDHTIAPMQAFFVPEGSSFVVYDAGSAETTRVNGESIKRKVLEVGDIIEFGESKFRFE